MASSAMPGLRIMTRRAHRRRNRSSSLPSQEPRMAVMMPLPDIFMTAGLPRKRATGKPAARCSPCMRK